MLLTRIEPNIGFAQTFLNYPSFNRLAESTPNIQQVLKIITLENFEIKYFFLFQDYQSRGKKLLQTITATNRDQDVLIDGTTTTRGLHHQYVDEIRTGFPIHIFRHLL